MDRPVGQQAAFGWSESTFLSGRVQRRVFGMHWPRPLLLAEATRQVTVPGIAIFLLLDVSPCFVEFLCLLHPDLNAMCCVVAAAYFSNMDTHPVPC